MAYKRSVRSLAAATAVGGMLAIAAAATPGSASAVHHAARATPVRATSAQTTARTNASAQVTTGAALQKALNQLVAMPYGPPGVIVIVQHGSRSAIYQAGTASLADRRPLSTSDHARLASFAKGPGQRSGCAQPGQQRLRRLSATIGQVLPALPRAWHSVTPAGRAAASQRPARLHQEQGAVQGSVSRGVIPRRDHPARPAAALRLRQAAAIPARQPLQVRQLSDNVVAAMMAEAVTGCSYNSLLRTLVYQLQ